MSRSRMDGRKIRATGGREEWNPRGPPLLGPMCREYNNKDVGEIGFLNLGSFCPLLKKGNFWREGKFRVSDAARNVVSTRDNIRMITEEVKDFNLELLAEESKYGTVAFKFSHLLEWMDLNRIYPYHGAARQILLSYRKIMSTMPIVIFHLEHLGCYDLCITYIHVLRYSNHLCRFGG